jgi:hypothetical protein
MKFCSWSCPQAYASGIFVFRGSICKRNTYCTSLNIRWPQIHRDCFFPTAVFREKLRKFKKCSYCRLGKDLYYAAANTKAFTGIRYQRKKRHIMHYPSLITRK